jgi:hypothetical protein
LEGQLAAIRQVMADAAHMAPASRRGNGATWLRLQVRCSGDYGAFGLIDTYHQPEFVVIQYRMLAVAIAAARCRRSDVLAVLLLGPAIALPICYFGEEWSDPEWFLVPAVCMICWIVSTAVGGSYWIVSKLRRAEVHESEVATAATSPADRLPGTP